VPGIGVSDKKRRLYKQSSESGLRGSRASNRLLLSGCMRPTSGEKEAVFNVLRESQTWRKEKGQKRALALDHLGRLEKIEEGGWKKRTFEGEWPSRNRTSSLNKLWYRDL